MCVYVTKRALARVHDKRTHVATSTQAARLCEPGPPQNTFALVWAFNSIRVYLIMRYKLYTRVQRTRARARICCGRRCQQRACVCSFFVCARVRVLIRNLIVNAHSQIDLTTNVGHSPSQQRRIGLHMSEWGRPGEDANGGTPPRNSIML